MLVYMNSALTFKGRADFGDFCCCYKPVKSHSCNSKVVCGSRQSTLISIPRERKFLGKTSYHRLSHDWKNNTLRPIKCCRCKLYQEDDEEEEEEEVSFGGFRRCGCDGKYQQIVDLLVEGKCCKNKKETYVKSSGGHKRESFVGLRYGSDETFTGVLGRKQAGYGSSSGEQNRVLRACSGDSSWIGNKWSSSSLESTNRRVQLICALESRKLDGILKRKVDSGKTWSELKDSIRWASAEFVKKTNDSSDTHSCLSLYEQTADLANGSAADEMQKKNVYDRVDSRSRNKVHWAPSVQLQEQESEKEKTGSVFTKVNSTGESAIDSCKLRKQKISCVGSVKQPAQKTKQEVPNGDDFVFSRYEELDSNVKQESLKAGQKISRANSSLGTSSAKQPTRKQAAIDNVDFVFNRYEELDSLVKQESLKAAHKISSASSSLGTSSTKQPIRKQSSETRKQEVNSSDDFVSNRYEELDSQVKQPSLKTAQGTSNSGSNLGISFTNQPSETRKQSSRIRKQEASSSGNFALDKYEELDSQAMQESLRARHGMSSAVITSTNQPSPTRKQETSSSGNFVLDDYVELDSQAKQEPSKARLGISRAGSSLGISLTKQASQTRKQEASITGNFVLNEYEKLDSQVTQESLKETKKQGSWTSSNYSGVSARWDSSSLSMPEDVKNSGQNELKSQSDYTRKQREQTLHEGSAAQEVVLSSNQHKEAEKRTSEQLLKKQQTVDNEKYGSRERLRYSSSMFKENNNLININAGNSLRKSNSASSSDRVTITELGSERVKPSTYYKDDRSAKKSLEPSGREQTKESINRKESIVKANQQCSELATSSMHLGKQIDSYTSTVGKTKYTADNRLENRVAIAGSPLAQSGKFELMGVAEPMQKKQITEIQTQNSEDSESSLAMFSAEGNDAQSLTEKASQESPLQIPHPGRVASEGPSEEVWAITGWSSRDESTDYRSSDKEKEKNYELSASEESSEKLKSSSAEVEVDKDTDPKSEENEKIIAKRPTRGLWGVLVDFCLHGWTLHQVQNTTSKPDPAKTLTESPESEDWHSAPEFEDKEVNQKRKKKQNKDKGKLKASGQVEVSPGLGLDPALESTKDETDKMGKMKFKHSVSDSSLYKPKTTRRHIVRVGNQHIQIIRKTNEKFDSCSTLSKEEVAQANLPKGTILETSEASRKDEIELPKVLSSYSSNEEKESRSKTEKSIAETSGSENSSKVSEIEEHNHPTNRFKRSNQLQKEDFSSWEEALAFESEQRKEDERFMEAAIEEAKSAADAWEVPVGAVLVQNGKIIARAHNKVEENRDATSHAEMICIRMASNVLKSWRLSDTTLYVTLEPCPMCAGAILQARIKTVVWGAPNKLLGADGSWISLFPRSNDQSMEGTSIGGFVAPIHPFHPNVIVRRGVLADECSEVMQQFFKLRRKMNKRNGPRSHVSLIKHPSKFFSKLHEIFSIFCI